MGRLCPYANPCCWLETTITLTVVPSRDSKCVCPQAGNTFSCFTFFFGYVQNGIHYTLLILIYAGCSMYTWQGVQIFNMHEILVHFPKCAVHTVRNHVSQNAMCSTWPYISYEINEQETVSTTILTFSTKYLIRLIKGCCCFLTNKYDDQYCY